MGALVDIKTTEVIYLESFTGVEVEVTTAVSMADFMTLAKLADIAGGNSEGVQEAIQIFGDKFLMAWNVTLNGNEVEPNGESLARMPLSFQWELTSKWFGLIRGVSGPLGSASSTPSDSPEQSTGEPDGV